MVLNEFVWMDIPLDILFYPHLDQMQALILLSHE
jgi:hypothetical protein